MESLVSIIIVNFNNNEYTLDCLKSLITQTYRNFEIILIDNASKYEIYLNLKRDIAKFKKQLNINLVRNNRCLYFSGGNNKGIKIARGKYICLLNNDTEVESNFIEKMIKFLEENKDAGMISPKIKVFKNKNVIWYAGASITLGKVFYTSHRGIWVNDPDNRMFSEIMKTDYATGAALFFPKEIIKKIGLLDEIYFMYSEEVDWNLRAKKEGFNIYYVPNTIVYHKVSKGIINKKIRRSLFKSYFYNRNSQIFTWTHSKFRNLISFYLKYIFINIKYFASKLIKRELNSIYVQLFSIIQGFRIGVKRRTNQSCQKELIKNFNFINNHVLKLYRPK
ncbi:MAG: glycosyltransferase family 2 protein [Promethearchaeota archaeon]